ncbi:MAG: type II secretion system F family protein [Actinobacteria bacterium]|nr:MAG: type II secretion system F family protein [Actinomycetota bacterium]
MAGWVISLTGGTALFLALSWLRASLEPLAVLAAGLGGTARVRTGVPRALCALGDMVWARRLVRPDLPRRRLELCGDPLTLQAATGLAVAAAALAVLGSVMAAFLFAPALALAPVASFGAIRGLEIVLGRTARRRQDRIAAGMPDLVELLVVTTEAGLSPPVALRRTAEVLRGPLGEELRSAIREVELGVPWLGAVERLAARCDVPALRGLASALSRSQHLGTVLGSSLRRVAEDLRRERRARAEEAARKAPIKMLIPLIFLILPAFLLLTVGPVVLATIRSLH